jgi:protein-L-isoaspartate(D-aspartate) O-methyltransferase
MDLAAKRAQLVENLNGEIKDTRVLNVMRRIPRERFVPEPFSYCAYNNEPLSIGHGQTISQPFIIALMTEALQLNGDEKVLEIGTGSGYQTAILAELSRKVISTERIPELAKQARSLLDELGYENITIHLTGNRLGWEKDAPYAAILVTAAAPQVPNSLLEQLAFGGKMVIPVGSIIIQQLYRITRRKEGNLVENLGGCRFVPLIGIEAWENTQICNQLKYE